MQNIVRRRLHPYLPEWLHHRHREDVHVSPDDVIRIAEYDARSGADPIVFEYLLRAARGELKRKVGRRRAKAQELRLLCAATEVEYLAARLTARRERQKKKGIRKTRSGYSPTDLALQVVANRFGFSSLEILRNALSSWNKERNSQV